MEGYENCHTVDVPDMAPGLRRLMPELFVLQAAPEGYADGIAADQQETARRLVMDDIATTVDRRRPGRYASFHR